MGFGVVNRGTTALTVEELGPSFPLGGLTVDAEAVPAPGACPTAFAPVPVTLRPGAEAVLQFVLTAADPRCLAPLPVDVEVTYGIDGGFTTPADLHAFPDLGGFDLPSQCSTPSG